MASAMAVSSTVDEAAHVDLFARGEGVFAPKFNFDLDGGGGGGSGMRTNIRVGIVHTPEAKPTTAE